MLEQLRGAESPEEFEQIKASIFGDTFQGDNDLEEDLSDDLFGDDESLFEDLFGECPFDDDSFASFEQEQEQQAAELDKLLSATSISKLFRRVARRIHPDLETDESQKQKKTKQMAELVVARGNKDIATILRMYGDIFGALPEDLSETDYPKLVKIINKQIEQLKESKFDVLDESPFYGAFYEWFSASNLCAETQKVEEFIRDAKLDEKEHLVLAASITSIKTLRPHLEKRYYMIHMPFDIPF